MINPVFAVTAIIGLMLPLLPSKDARTERRLYWVGALVASISAFLALYPDWRGGLGLAGALGGGLVLRAYMSTPYIIVRGRTFAFGLSHSRPADAGIDADDDPAPDSYGGLATATKAWWLLVVVVMGCAFILWIWVTEEEGPWYAVGAAAAVVIVAIGIGHQDGSWSYPVARGQVLQLTVAGVASIGVFAVLYLVAYAAGRRWPLRPKGSMDYRTHPHLRKKFPK
jgi:hypothetical protein